MNTSPVALTTSDGSNLLRATISGSADQLGEPQYDVRIELLSGSVNKYTKKLRVRIINVLTDTL